MKLAKSELPLKRADGSICEHTYPDVLRVRDEVRPDGKIVRILDCAHCGRIEMVMSSKSLNPTVLAELLRTGVLGGSEDADLSAIRTRERARIQAEKERFDALTLDDLLRESLPNGATKIDMYDIDPGLDLEYFYGQESSGDLINDREATDRILAEVEARAKLATPYGSGAFTWQHAGKTYQITVQAFEDEEEPTFRLTVNQDSLSKSRPKR